MQRAGHVKATDYVGQASCRYRFLRRAFVPIDPASSHPRQLKA